MTTLIFATRKAFLSYLANPENGLQRTVTALVTAKGMIKLTKLLKQH